ncbi:MAG: mRNA surveillance protein pelota [Candidatus Aenigmarchaeota archaeon]|nr:mRNA surveillance protein pelota [Candidatus Aenigmarchaeota archaeon]
MKILGYKEKKGVLRLEPETSNDLWLLEKILKPGDIIKGRTQRSIKIQRGDQEVRTERRTITVRLCAEKVDFSEDGSEIRVNGKILEGPEEVEHGYHTFEIRVNEPVSIERQWKKFELDKIYAAKIKHPRIMICVLDDSECTIAMLTERLQFLVNMQGVSGKTYGEADKTSYFSNIIKYIEEKDFDFLIVAGPGFTKEAIAKELKEKGVTMLVDSVSHTGEAGVQEVLKRGAVERLYHNSQIHKQTILVEKFFEELARDGKIVYGAKETEIAVKMGAVEELLISDILVRENEQLLGEAEKMGGKVHIIESHHEAGKRFANFGVAGFLRYRTE